MKYAHRYYAEFAREAMNDQMDMYEGQNEPMQIKWAIEGSGNPFDFESEAAKAESEVNDLKRKYTITVINQQSQVFDEQMRKDIDNIKHKRKKEQEILKMN